MNNIGKIHNFNGKNIPHITISENTSVVELIEKLSNSGFNAKQLADAAKRYAEMIENNTTICLAVAGAMTPIGFGGIIKTLIENGFVDWIVTTGANVYHEDHFAWGLPIKQGHFDVDDNILHQNQIVRIRDVFVKYFETLEIEDQILQKEFEEKFVDDVFTTPNLVNFMGHIGKIKSKYPEKSFITAAHDFDVPVFISTIKDSSIALNMVMHRLKNKIYKLDILREILEQSSIIHNSQKSGTIEIGGGVPKSIVEQAPQLLNQILESKQYGLDYVIQLTDARYEYGNYSGAELQTSKNWTRIKPDAKITSVYCDATIAFPLIALYVLATQKPRKHKKLYKKMNSFYNSLSKKFEKTKEI